jgi:hypothetical protein
MLAQKQAQKSKLNRILKIIEEAKMKVLAFFVLKEEEVRQII